MTRRGFTLIELLVVIAIIAILAAILFPVFAKAREKARQSSCLSNVKQIGLAVMQYKQDYDECWPWELYNVTWQPTVPLGWGGEIGPYVKNSQIFMCPSATTKVNCSYIWNLSLNFVSDGTITDPSTRIFMGESTTDAWWAADSATRIVAGTANCRLKGNHNDGANFGYCDGHAKWLGQSNWKAADWCSTW
jgi:prepilin-type N-terminal cleavage/methylation domain-containing protein/prepilin-type processing-associated H-X9-DG protein